MVSLWLMPATGRRFDSLLHGQLRFGYEPDDWDLIKLSWSLIDFDPYEPEWEGLV